MKLFFVKLQLIIVLVIGIKITYGQQVIIKNDTISTETDSVVTLVLPEYRGEFKWQVSYDQVEWITFPNETNDSLLVDLDMDAWYRAVIVEGTCDTVYSDTAQAIISDSLRNYYQSIVLPMAYPDEPGEIVEVFFNNDTITCRKVNDEYVFQGDMILTEKQVMQLDNNKGASIPTDDMFVNLWPEATVYYTIGSGLEEDLRISEAIQHWESRTPIRFKQRENEENYVEFTLVDKGCKSNVGMIGGKQHIWISKEKKYILVGDYIYKSFDVAHEIGHTIGLFHEHSRADRDEYIAVHENRIKDDIVYNYRKVSNSKSLGTFDFESIMLYPPCNKTAASGDNFVLMTKRDPITKEDSGIPWAPEYDKHKELSPRDIGFVYWLYSSAPFVKTAGVTNVSENTAFFAGNVANDGGSAVTERGFCWNTFDNPSNEDNFVKTGSGLGHFSTEINDLQPNTTYFVKAYAINDKGVSFGDTIIFTTYANYSIPTVQTININYQFVMIDNKWELQPWCFGELANDGGLPVTEKGFCWNKTGNPNTADVKIVDENNEAGFYSMKLEVDTTQFRTYYIKSFATNEKGTSYGEEIIFNYKVFEDNFPIISTHEVTNITQTSAKVGFLLTQNGNIEIQETGVIWNTTGNPTINYVESGKVFGSGYGDFSDTIYDLSPNTTYYVRAVVMIQLDDGKLPIYGNQVTFTTLPVFEPTAITSLATNVKSKGATLNGEITSDNGAPITQRGFYWCENCDEPGSNNKIVVSGTTGKFDYQLSNLKPQTRYAFRAFATNSAGTGTGNVNYFVTDAEPITIPSVTTNAITEITQTTATGGGNVTSDGGAPVTARGICWAVSENPTINDSKTTDGSGTGSFSSTLSGLTAGVTYYVRAYATNSKGTAYGTQKTFTTKTEEATSGTFTDSRDGNTYKWVKIGEQIWMAENLAYLPEVSPPSEISYTLPYCYVYGYNGTDINDAKATQNYANHGVLYNWSYTKEVCPPGWHLPTDDEWKLLEMAIGMSQIDADEYGWRGTNEGKKLKTISGWNQNGNGTDDYGFSASPSGLLYNSGSFGDITNFTFWWDVREDLTIPAGTRGLSYGSGKISRQGGSLAAGFSVRCVKD